MARKNRNARQRDKPRKTKINLKRKKINVRMYPKKQKTDIYPGKVVAVAELQKNNKEAVV